MAVHVFFFLLMGLPRLFLENSKVDPIIDAFAGFWCYFSPGKVPHVRLLSPEVSPRHIEMKAGPPSGPSGAPSFPIPARHSKSRALDTFFGRFSLYRRRVPLRPFFRRPRKSRVIKNSEESCAFFLQWFSPQCPSSTPVRALRQSS